MSVSKTMTVSLEIRRSSVFLSSSSMERCLQFLIHSVGVLFLPAPCLDFPLTVRSAVLKETNV